MVDFSLFRLRDEVADFDAFVEFNDDRQVVPVGPIDGGDFTAKLYFVESSRRRPPWVSFLDEGFPGAIGWQPSRTTSALVVINAEPGVGRYFALAFGPGGRHILRGDAYQRRYGLTTALNLIAATDAQPQLRAVDTTRHGRSILRSRLQTASLSTVDVFELDVLRDLMRRATGRPADVEQWGKRVGGSDAVRLARDIRFSQLGEFCLSVDELASATTYRERFDWIDNIRPVSDRQTLGSLEDEVARLLRDARTDILQLAPPEVVDWDVLSGFRYHFDTRLKTPMTRNDLFLNAYLSGLRQADPDLDELTPDFLKRRRIVGLNEDSDQCGEWTVWRCLVGEFEYQGQSFVLEDGVFYRVTESYLQRLNEDILPFSSEAELLPSAKIGETEPQYNRTAADSSDGFLLLDASLIHTEGASGGIELCDLLTDKRQFVHVKRYGGSQKLSHLFAQVGRGY